MTSRRWLVVALAVAAVVLLVGRAAATVYADYRWYEAMGAAELWRCGAVSSMRPVGMAAAQWRAGCHARCEVTHDSTRRSPLRGPALPIPMRSRR